MNERDHILHSASLDAGDVFRTLYHTLGRNDPLTNAALEVYIGIRQTLPRAHNGKHVGHYEAHNSTN